ncbi:hypothetical protein [Ramlibacter humi]|uniref:Uncharacterized protein n=1 Tax=Ramlibacter humi TaxID=2530451 RepID=A0A4Z0BE70_9BURK|nr:hypothetical protein [Ramlibacter humi]TFY97615.1 hypothetical protein EZ216_17965 [Ramlibacter humi]
MQEVPPWYRSVAVKSCLIAFVATHIPLLGLIAVIVLRPEWLSPWGVFLAALVFTLVATGIVIGVLWRMFRPLRDAADGLHVFMSEGRLFAPTGGGRDEVGRLVQTLVKSLAHVERGRAALLDAGAFALASHGEAGGTAMPSRGWLALVEVDQWEELDREGRPRDLMAVQRAMTATLQEVLTDDELLMPWGRGRCLAMLLGSGTEVVERLEAACRRVPVGEAEVHLTASAVVEPSEAGPRSWAAGLQRLENKLFALRMRGAQAQVA